MAEVIPFNGVVYNPELIPDLGAVTAPPYDVISEEEQERFYAAHPDNVIRLILGKTGASDTDQDNRYTRSAAYYNAWRSEKILIRDEKPALYLGATDFPLDGERVRRLGLIARIRLEPFEKRVVLPHEKTFSKVRSDRFNLMKACHVNFSPVFALYSDEDGILENLKKHIDGRASEMDFKDSSGHRQQVWRLTDPAVHAYVLNAMKSRIIYIADGHHRYETALNYREWTAQKDPHFSPDHPANYIMMSLTSMDDPGMVILPAHRLIKEVSEDTLANLIPKAEAYFNIKTFPLEPGRSQALDAFKTALADGAKEHSIGVHIKNQKDLYLLKLKPGVMETLYGHELHPVMLRIDVTVLTRLIFMDLLGFDQARLDNEKLIGYTTLPEKAAQEVAAGRYDAAFILNPTRIEQVQDIAREGLIMPRKATYFYPKIVSGHVMNPLKPE